jgi:hypothetical protein
MLRNVTIVALTPCNNKHLINEQSYMFTALKNVYINVYEWDVPIKKT